MRKIVSILFLLLTGIAVMLHAAIPHHHHSKVFTYVIESLGEDTQRLFSHHVADYSHYEIGNLNVAIHHVQQTATSLHVQSPAVCIPATDNNLSPADPPHYVSVMPKPYLVSDYSAIIVNSLGLRAPPSYC